MRLIRETSGLVHNARFTRYPDGEWISFRVQGWEVPALKGAEGGAYQDCILLFVFANLPSRLDLYLQVGPGDEETRDKLFHMAHSNRASFKDAAEPLRRETRIFLRPILTPEFYEEATDSDRENEIRKQWAEFLEEDLPRIDAVLKKERWIWESGEASKFEEASGRSDRFGWGDGDIVITRRPGETDEQSED